jgi:hypothetical protein
MIVDKFVNQMKAPTSEIETITDVTEQQFLQIRRISRTMMALFLADI